MKHPPPTHYDPSVPSRSSRTTWLGCIVSCVIAAAWSCPAIAAGVKVDEGIYLIGRIQEKSISESSGLVASRQRPGLFWTHNDQGHIPVLFGIDRAGHLVSQHRINADLEDWEDLAIDASGQLYLGDLGNNEVTRDELVVYRVKEPTASDPIGAITPNAKWRLRFSQDSFDCESLFIDEGKGYVISKVFNDARGEIFSFDLGVTNVPQTLAKVATLPVTSPITGADLSSDRQRLGIVCKAGAYVLTINGDISAVERIPFHRDKFKKGQIEACAFVPEGLLATEEGRDIYLFVNPAYSASD